MKALPGTRWQRLTAIFNRRPLTPAAAAPKPPRPPELPPFRPDPAPPDGMSPLALAYLGDAVYELHIRSLLISRGITQANQLHPAAVQYVRAPAQAALLLRLMPLLTPEEKDIVRRGRNAKPGHIPRSADGPTYHSSTAFECLIGYLYASGQMERLQTLFDAGEQAE